MCRMDTEVHAFTLLQVGEKVRKDSRLRVTLGQKAYA